MKSKKFDEVKPYTYWIQNISTGIKYVGLRYKNISLKKTPLEDFGIYYFTSGKLKKEFKQNPKKFKTKLLFTYDDIEEARKHEQELTKKIYKKYTKRKTVAPPICHFIYKFHYMPICIF